VLYRKLKPDVLIKNLINKRESDFHVLEIIWPRQVVHMLLYHYQENVQ
jgi:hypothetical protein